MHVLYIMSEFSLRDVSDEGMFLASAISFMQICKIHLYYVHIYVSHLILLLGIKEYSIVNKNIQRKHTDVLFYPFVMPTSA